MTKTFVAEFNGNDPFRVGDRLIVPFGLTLDQLVKLIADECVMSVEDVDLTEWTVRFA